MKQIILVHGGSTFTTYKKFINFLKTFEPKIEYLKKKTWKDSLQLKVGKDFEVLQMQMPNKLNSKYNEWKIYFERYIPLFSDKVVLIGHSLGGIFLAKYLSENYFPKKIVATFLIASPYNSNGVTESLGDFKLNKNINRFAEQSFKIFIYHSKDDSIVPVEHAERYKHNLLKANIKLLDGVGHFNQLKFSEIVKDIRNLKW